MAILTILIASMTVVGPFYTQEAKQQLMTSYQEKSSEKLQLFLKAWYDRSQLKVGSASKERIVMQIYEVYKSFFKPMDYDTLFTRDEKNMIHNRSFLIIQDRIKAFVVDSPECILSRTEKGDNLLRKSKMVSVRDFRPDLRSESASILFLAGENKEVIKFFLGGTENADGRIETPHNDHQRREALDKANFLRRCLWIQPSHWNDYWIVETEPYVNAIFIDKHFTTALISYSIRWNVGECVLKRQGSKWVITRNQIVGTE